MHVQRKCLVKILALAVTICPTLCTTVAWCAATGELEIHVVDRDTSEPVAVRVTLTNSRGRIVRPKAIKNFGRYFCFDGRAVLKLPVGEYRFEMQRGPEYRIRTGHFSISRGAEDNETVEMHRFAKMSNEGWYSGDLEIGHRTQDIPLLLLAEDLHIGNAIAWSNNSRPDDHTVEASPVTAVGKLRRFGRNAASDSRLFGSITVSGLASKIPLPSQDSHATLFDSMRAIRRQPNSHVDFNTVCHWDLPVWVASKQIDSIAILNSSMCAVPDKRAIARGRLPDPVVYSSPQGYARWSLDIYYELLNTGVRIPPSASSGAGFVNNPVGFNRVYVYCGEDFSYENWWKKLREGCSVITNGPLLRPFANGYPPGQIFKGQPGETLEIDVALKLSTRDRISYLQLVKNGRSVADIRLDEYAKAGGKLPIVEFKQSGWLMVRAVCDDATRLRYATSAPFYVEFDKSPRISRSSCEFFLDWAQKRISQIREVKDDTVREALSRYHQAGIRYWQKQVEIANAD